MPRRYYAKNVPTGWRKQFGQDDVSATPFATVVTPPESVSQHRYHLDPAPQRSDFQGTDQES
jgi:hypothetical protein